MEGVSYQLRAAIEGLEEAFKVKILKIKVVGGGSKNKLWNRIRTDVAGRLIVTSRIREARSPGQPSQPSKELVSSRASRKLLQVWRRGWKAMLPARTPRAMESFTRLI